MMYGAEKSDSLIVASKPTNKAERAAAEPVERRGVGQEERGKAAHVQDSVPGKRAPAARPRAASRKAGRRTVHRATAPCERRFAAVVVLLAEAEGPGIREMAGKRHENWKMSSFRARFEEIFSRIHESREVL